MFASGVAGIEEKALILCSLLLGFGLDAYLCVGKRSRSARAAAPESGATAEEGHMWVATLSDEPASRPHFWDPSPGGPLTAIACLFNHHTVYANAQEDSDPQTCSYELQHRDAWSALDCASAPMPEQPACAVMQPFGGLVAEVAQQEVALERELKNAILDGRAGKNVRWSAELEHLLMPALAVYEREAKHGAPAAAAEGTPSSRPSGEPRRGVSLSRGSPSSSPGGASPSRAGPSWRVCSTTRPPWPCWPCGTLPPASPSG